MRGDDGLRSFGSAGILSAFLNLRFAAVLAFLFVQTERQRSRLEAGATKERCRDMRQESTVEVRCSVAQAILPVPQVARCSAMRN
jgi:hypothetical protein